MDMSDFVIPEQVKKATPIVTCVVEGILDEEDLRVLAGGGEGRPGDGSLPTTSIEPDDPSDLKKIREKHHSVARLVAGGMSQRMTAMIAGYTEGYVSILLNSPAMQELVEMYRMQAGASAAVITEKLRTVGTTALEKLQLKIDEDACTVQELLSAAKLGADRSGHGPSSQHHVVTEEHILDHAEITRLNAEARRGSRSSIIPIEEARNASHTLAPPVPGDQASLGFGSPAGNDDGSAGDEHPSAKGSAS